MATLELQGTKFTFSVLPLKLFSNRDWVRTEIAIENEYVRYRETGRKLLREEFEKWIFSMFRLLAGAYGKEYSVAFEREGLAIDLYPYTENGCEVSREERRRKDCVMAIRLLLRTSDQRRFLGGVYSFLFHRDEIETFATALQREFGEVFGKPGRGKGKYLFAGVSPRGYRGCNYWYLDKSGTVKPGDYVWVRMGRHNTEQIVCVDSIRYCDDDTAPYDPASVKQILRKAESEELSSVAFPAFADE